MKFLSLLSFLLLACCGVACQGLPGPKIPAGFTLITKANAQGRPEYRHEKTGIIFVSIPGGSCTVGSPESEAGRDADERMHSVTLTPFLIAKYEVSQAEWEKVMGTNPSDLVKDPEMPVHFVTWNDCMKFAEKSGLSLPTAAQWEYACQGGPNDPTKSGATVEDMGWISTNSEGRLHRRGEKGPNGYGLHDMYGNAFERCKDTYDAAFYDRPESSGVNPECKTPTGQGERRGGDCRHTVKFARSANRGGCAVDDPAHVIATLRPAVSL